MTDHNPTGSVPRSEWRAALDRAADAEERAARDAMALAKLREERDVLVQRLEAAERAHEATREALTRLYDAASPYYSADGFVEPRVRALSAALILAAEHRARPASEEDP